MKFFATILISIAAIEVVCAGSGPQYPYQSSPNPYPPSTYTSPYPPTQQPYKNNKPYSTPSYGGNAYQPNYNNAPANYSYAYTVMGNADGYGAAGSGYGGGSYATPATPVNFGAEESRLGDYTKGSYFVQLPDGRIERVNYYVNGYSGFVADVTFEPAPSTYPMPYGGTPSGYTGGSAGSGMTPSYGAPYSPPKPYQANAGAGSMPTAGSGMMQGASYPPYPNPSPYTNPYPIH